MQPISDFYCKPANEAEAREIVERALAHGANLHESVGEGGNEYGWNEYAYWGVFNGTTMTGQSSFERPEIEHLTLDQLRESAPFVTELCPDEVSIVQEGVYRPFQIFEWRWKACRRALYFAGLLNIPATEEDLKKAAASLDQDVKAQIEAGTSALFANLTSPESANAADKMFEASDEEFAEAYRQPQLSAEARIALDSFDPVPGGIPAQSSRGAGLKFDGGKPQMRLLPPVAILEMAKVMTFGAEKYEADSWRQVEGAKERYLDALGRHYNSWCRGEKVDDESGLSHMAHIMCNAAFLLELEQEVKE